MVEPHDDGVQVPAVLTHHWPGMSSVLRVCLRYKHQRAEKSEQCTPVFEMTHNNMVCEDSEWGEEEWNEVFTDMDHLEVDIIDDRTAMELIHQLDQTLYLDDSLGKQKEMRFTNFEFENFDKEQNICTVEEHYFHGDNFEESEKDRRCLRLMSSGTVTQVTDAGAEQRLVPLIPSSSLDSDNKCQVKVVKKLVKSFVCTWPDCDKRYKKSSHLKVTTSLFLFIIWHEAPGSPAGPHGRAALHVHSPRLRPHLRPVSQEICSI